MSIITKETLVQYLYGETSKEDNLIIEAALTTDWKLNEEFTILKASQSDLKKLSLQSPKSSSIDRILKYAEQKSDSTIPVAP
ncbi:MAG: hypothetical protein ABS68_02375 [Niastella sp. SCN 39-18]|nr:hypothetical protein [Sphingobacteriales bacterium]ODT54199.1 MAG: hypothetical protein ABS68_02375 [Niastella sp. SCN 39-18]OJW09575.1 MAG: hypothetical protein BGO53_06805 [Sphingobacteriales bacterium 39-19]